MELMDARQKHACAEDKLNRVKEALAVWSTVNGKELATCQFEWQILIEWLQEGWVTEDKRGETIQYKKGLTEKIKQFEKSKREHERASRCERDIVQRTKKSLTIEEGKVPKQQWILRTKIEEILKKEGVDATVYHGGDLTGNSVRNLMAKATDIFTKLLELLMNEAEDRELPASKN
jgi:hypothetical protein